MAQSRRMTVVEATSDLVASVILGASINFVMVPWFTGVAISVWEATTYSGVFLAVGFVKRYLFRRAFVWLELRGIN